MIVMEAVYWGGRWLRHGDGYLCLQIVEKPNSKRCVSAIPFKKGGGYLTGLPADLKNLKKT